MIVLDANILIRAILGRRVWQLVEMYAERGVSFYAPDVAFEDAERYLPLLLVLEGKRLTVPRPRLTPVRICRRDSYSPQNSPSETRSEHHEWARSCH